MFEPMIEKAKNVPVDVLEAAKKVWFAGLGVVALAQEEGGKVWSDLVHKGEEYETGKEQLAKLSGAMKDAGEKARETYGRVGKEIETRVTSTLHRVGVPTVDEISVLTRKVEALSAGVDKLKAKSKAEPKEPKAPKH